MWEIIQSSILSAWQEFKQLNSPYVRFAFPQTPVITDGTIDVYFLIALSKDKTSQDAYGDTNLHMRLTKHPKHNSISVNIFAETDSPDIRRALSKFLVFLAEWKWAKSALKNLSEWKEYTLRFQPSILSVR